METLTIICSVCGLVFGFAGMVLGIMSFWRDLDRDRVHVVVMAFIRHQPVKGQGFGLEVRNLSYIPVTIEKAGFTRKASEFEVGISQTNFGQLPQMMQPRTSMTIEAFISSDDFPQLSDVHRGYIDTACRCHFEADASIVSDYAKNAANSAKSHV